MGIGYTIDVAAAFQSQRDRARRPTQDELEEIMLDAALTGENVSMQNARVDTGYMQGKVDHRIDGTKITLECDVDYAIYNERGTFKMSAQPFIEPGLDAMLNVLNRRLGFSGDDEDNGNNSIRVNEEFDYNN